MDQWRPDDPDAVARVAQKVSEGLFDRVVVITFAHTMEVTPDGPENSLSMGIEGRRAKSAAMSCSSPSIADFLRRQGNGNLSAGIQKVAVRAILDELNGHSRLTGIKQGHK
jgi:hypothetical protein